MVGNTQLIDYYRSTHARRVYGTSSVKYLRFLRPWIGLIQPGSVLDYGCGQSRLIDVLGLAEGVQRWRYDPAIPGYATRPAEAADLLINIDVLEHIEEPDLDGVLADMAALGRRALIVIDTVPAKHRLPDGRNAHVTLKSHDWWRERLLRHYPEVEAMPTPRRSRAGFKTWVSTAPEWMRYRHLRLREDALHLGKWLSGRHNEHWKVSTTLNRDKAR
ncbi:MAG: hypothetical protein R3D57_08960 [Hyphomicrobiaceae bacterium]